MLNLHSARERFIGYLKDKKRADATVVAYSKDIQQVVEYLEKNKKINAEDVQKDDFENFLKHLYENNYTKKTISRKINAIKTFCKYLLDQGHIKTDPAQYIQHPKLDQNAPRILSKIEYRALRDTVRNDVRSRAIVEVLLQTGVKINELSKMKLEDIKFSEGDEQGVLKVNPSGSSPGREIPLNTPVQEAIKDYIKERPESEFDNLFITKTPS